MINIKDIVPEAELIYCKTCEQFVILSKKYMKRSCKCTRVGRNNEWWVYYEDGEKFEGDMPRNYY
jgi:hypothetical protein